MPLPHDVIESIAQSMIKEFHETDLWIQERLENFFPLVWQLADNTNPAWLSGDFVDAKLRAHGVLEHVEETGAGDEVYMRIADRIFELAAVGRPPAIPPAPGLLVPPDGRT